MSETRLRAEREARPVRARADPDDPYRGRIRLRPLLELQRLVGNQATMRLLRSAPVPAERDPEPVDTDMPDQVSERDADRTAEALVGMRAPSGPGAGAPLADRQRPGLPSEAPAPSTGGRPLPAAERAFFEERLGQDLGHVRVHDGAGAARWARALSAQAFTWGRDIVFAAGRYAPHSVEGRWLLAHELAHVLQQQMTSPRIQRRAALADSREKEVARNLVESVALMKAGVGLLLTPGQADLLQEMVRTLEQLLPDRFGVRNDRGDVTRPSAELSTLIEIRRAGEAIGTPFDYRFRLYLTHEDLKPADGRYVPFGSWGGQLLLSIPRLAGRPPDDLAALIVHEMTHMLVHARRSLEERFGTEAAGRYPSRAAAPLLDVHAFAGLRAPLERRLEALVDYLNRQPHRRLTPLAAETATRWADLLVEEVLAYVYSDQVSEAVATAAGQRQLRGPARPAPPGTPRAAVTMGKGFVPAKFLKEYLREHWLHYPDDRAALDAPRGQRLLEGMAADVEALGAAVRAQLAR